VRGGSSGGWPAGTAALPRQNPRSNFLLSFFESESSPTPLIPTSNLKKSNIVTPVLDQKRKRFLPLLSLFFGSVCVVDRFCLTRVYGPFGLCLECVWSETGFGFLGFGCWKI